MSCSGCLRNAYKVSGSRKKCLVFSEAVIIREMGYTPIPFGYSLHHFISGFFSSKIGMPLSDGKNGVGGASPRPLFVIPPLSCEMASLFPSKEKGDDMI